MVKDKKIREYKKRVFIKFSLIICSVVGSYSLFIYLSYPQFFKLSIVVGFFIYLILAILSIVYMNKTLKQDTALVNKILNDK